MLACCCHFFLLPLVIAQMCGEKIVLQMCLKTAQRKEWLVSSLISKLLLTHCVCTRWKDTAGRQGEELGQNVLVLSLSLVSGNSCWANTLRDPLADNKHSAPTVSMDREERSVSVHDLGIGNLQMWKCHHFSPHSSPLWIFLGWDFILLRLGVNALWMHWPNSVSFETLVQIRGILTSYRICVKYRTREVFHGNSLRQRLVLVALFHKKALTKYVWWMMYVCMYVKMYVVRWVELLGFFQNKT